MPETQKPEERPGYSILRIRKIGICGTDLHAAGRARAGSLHGRFRSRVWRRRERTNMKSDSGIIGVVLPS